MRKFNNIHRILFYCCLLFIGADLCYTFLFYWNTPIDGDLAAIVLPKDDYQAILEDPFGLKVMLNGVPHSGPNRFFAYAFTYGYFNTIPYFLQYFTSPIDSIYLASALLKIASHIGFMLLISQWIIGPKLKWNLQLIVILALLAPLFQSAVHPGLSVFMNVIDASVSYMIAYAFSLLLLLIYLSPFLQMLLHRREARFSTFQGIIWFLLAIIISLNGPLNTPVIMLSVPLLFFCFIQQQTANSFLHRLRNIPAFIYLHLGFIISLGLYSFYLGTFNLENPTDPPSIYERYVLWGKGFRFLFIGINSPSPLLILVLLSIINSVILWKSADFNKMKKVYACMLLFSVIYLISIPLGGYRPYRPEILRYDVILPVTFCIIFIFVSSTYKVLFQLKAKQLYAYIVIPLSVSLFFTIVDQHDLGSNTCEKAALRTLSVSKQDTVPLPECKVLSWETFSNPAKSTFPARMLFRWNITPKVTYYYHKKTIKKKKSSH